MPNTHSPLPMLTFMVFSNDWHNIVDVKETEVPSQESLEMLDRHTTRGGVMKWTHRARRLRGTTLRQCLIPPTPPNFPNFTLHGNHIEILNIASDPCMEC